MKKDLRPFLLAIRNRHFVAIDLLILLVCPALVLFMRLDFTSHFGPLMSPLMLYTAIFLVLKPVLFWQSKLYSPFWAYASVEALKLLVRCGAVTLVAELAIFFGLLMPLGILPAGFPRSIPLMNGVVTMLLVGAARLAVRMLFEASSNAVSSVSVKPVLIIGAGFTGASVVKELRMNPQLGLKPVGFLDDDERLHGRRIHGVMVVGPISSLPEAVKNYHPQQVIVAMPSAPGKAVRGVVEACKQVGVTSRTVPGIFEITSGMARVSELREIEIEDLLQRGVVKTDPGDVQHLLKGKRVMVTGGGGSIGSELCRQIILAEPSELILVGHGENSIFKIEKELNQHFDPAKIHAVIADIRDRKRLHGLFRTCRPQVIFHAAAHKHVGLMQSNIPDAVTNNVLGTRTMVELAARFDAESFVMISSDKAVNPTSIMGATKRIAELIVHDAAVTTGRPFVSVRFGNVLGSRGSVVPIFKSQIAAGGPVTVSHPDVTRYFMTIPEAVQLVLQASAMGTGGEVYVLDMGEPIKIVDLAKDVIRLSGLQVGKDIEIVFTGLKQGEKLHEELFRTGELPVRSAHEKIFVCKNMARTDDTLLPLDSGIVLPEDTGVGEGDPVLRQRIGELIHGAQVGDLTVMRDLINTIVPECGMVEGEGVVQRGQIMESLGVAQGAGVEDK